MALYRKLNPQRAKTRGNLRISEAPTKISNISTPNLQSLGVKPRIDFAFTKDDSTTRSYAGFNFSSSRNQAPYSRVTPLDKDYGDDSSMRSTEKRFL